ncbi:VWA-like domain-containing protein [Chamaesiphon sp. GL140_3_metabinner_50]|uniref:vWA domain-containing protein n=1 Tax=Chamaesiphon sp. GL140_3_metabinner_50 TaxID=2970812 RepID=UPI0025DC3CD3|nr:VWA-like domain-containing protein [Chamaesiphon sp. GL140_3_metabinner_50]
MNDCLPTVDFANLISACLLRLRMKSPFFGTLAMFARFVPSLTIPYAATDGRDIFLNPEFLQSLPKEQQDGILLHEILHAALLHSLRLNEREPELWNIAADIVVNGTISRQTGIELPPGGLRDEQLEHLSVEEVYELLRSDEDDRFDLADLDILAMKAGDSGDRSVQGMEQKERESLAAHWRQAIQQATAVARATQWGKLAIGSEREFEMVVNPQLDWKAQLWRFLVRTPTDFLNFDRRFVGRGLYLEALQGESVRVYLAIDTSGSIGSETLRLFMSELDGILGSYPHLKCDLYYVDTDLYGPYRLNVDTPIPPPEGGGGTSFVPFFDRVAATYDEHTQAVCIYLTDGFGEFPVATSVLPTLWVVTPGGLDVSQFPFGEAIRLVRG